MASDKYSPLAWGLRNEYDVKSIQLLYGLPTTGVIDDATIEAITDYLQYYGGLLDDVEVVGHKPTLWDDLVKGFTPRHDNPIFGSDRIRLVDRYYGKDNPFRLGSDLLGNGIIDIALTLSGLGGATKAAWLVKSLGAKAIPTIAAAIAGGYVGADAVNSALIESTGQDWNYWAQNAGLDSYGAAMSNPGGWAGSYATSKLTNGIQLNALAWLQNRMPLLVMTSRGPVMLQPGESVVDYSRPTGLQEGATPGSSIYLAPYTSRHAGGARGAASGQGNHSRSTFGTRTTSNGVGHRQMANTYTGRNADPFSYEQAWQPTAFNPTYGVPLPYTIFPPVEPQVGGPGEILIPLLPKEDYRYEVFTNPHSSFEKWFSGLVQRGKLGSILYYSGDDLHRAGPYVIGFGGKASNNQRDVYDSELYLIPDSLTVISNIPEGRQLDTPYRLSGGVPKEAKRGKKYGDK